MRTPAVGLLTVALGLAGALALSSQGGLLLPTARGLVRLDAEEAALYLTVQEYLRQRMQEVAAVRPGMTYDELSRLFYRDGGLSSPPPHRFVHVLCPFIKLEIEFEGEDVGGPYVVFPPDVRIARVSRHYFQHPYTD